MATYTENYNLIMPEENDFYNVENYNENFQMIDDVMATAENELSKLNDKIGTPDDNGNKTVFGLLNSGTSFIKSIQHIIRSTDDSNTVSINTVDPSKCIVIMERLQFPNTKNSSVTYDLEASIFTSTISADGYFASAGFWIIEFC